MTRSGVPADDWHRWLAVYVPCTYICIYVHVYIYIYTYACMYVCMHACMCNVCISCNEPLLPCELWQRIQRPGAGSAKLSFVCRIALGNSSGGVITESRHLENSICIVIVKCGIIWHGIEYYDIVECGIIWYSMLRSAYARSGGCGCLVRRQVWTYHLPTML